ncbi:MAG: hypothetical protein P8Y70_14195 [Candidatus Lokiarchaeota archaeon]
MQFITHDYANQFALINDMNVMHTEQRLSIYQKFQKDLKNIILKKYINLPNSEKANLIKMASLYLSYSIFGPGYGKNDFINNLYTFLYKVQQGDSTENEDWLFNVEDNKYSNKILEVGFELFNKNEDYNKIIEQSFFTLLFKNEKIGRDMRYFSTESEYFGLTFPTMWENDRDLVKLKTLNTHQKFLDLFQDPELLNAISEKGSIKITLFNEVGGGFSPENFIFKTGSDQMGRSSIELDLRDPRKLNNQIASLILYLYYNPKSLAVAHFGNQRNSKDWEYIAFMDLTGIKAPEDVFSSYSREDFQKIQEGDFFWEKIGKVTYFRRNFVIPFRNSKDNYFTARDYRYFPAFGEGIHNELMELFFHLYTDDENGIYRETIDNGDPLLKDEELDFIKNYGYEDMFFEFLRLVNG